MNLWTKIIYNNDSELIYILKIGSSVNETVIKGFN